MNDDRRKDEIKRHHIYVATQKPPEQLGARGEEGKEPGASGDQGPDEGEEPDVLVDEMARTYTQYVLYSRSATVTGTIIDSGATAPVVTSTEHCSDIVSCNEVIPVGGGSEVRCTRRATIPAHYHLVSWAGMSLLRYVTASSCPSSASTSSPAPVHLH